MKATVRMIWECGVCHLTWESKEEAEWCCTQECEQATAHFGVKQEVEAEQKKFPESEFPGRTI